MNEELKQRLDEKFQDLSKEELQEKIEDLMTENGDLAVENTDMFKALSNTKAVVSDLERLADQFEGELVKHRKDAEKWKYKYAILGEHISNLASNSRLHFLDEASFLDAVMEIYLEIQNEKYTQDCGPCVDRSEVVDK